jgi:flagellar protein FlaE
MLDRLTTMFGTNDTEAGSGDDEQPGASTDGEAATDDRSDLEWQSGELVDADGSTATDGGPSGDGAPTTAELDVRMSDLEEELESTSASVRAVRNSQEEMADSVAEVTDTVRQLVGVYDQLAAERNPFLDGADDGAVVGDTAVAADESETTFAHESADDDDTKPPEEDADHDAGGDRANGTGDDVVSFDDLRNGATNSESPSEGVDDHHDDGGTETGVDAGNPGATTDIGIDGRNGTGTGTETSGRPDGHDGESTDVADGAVLGADGVPPRQGTRAADRGAALAAVPDGYAGEVVVMEWLATLMAESAAAGAVRAIEHYQDADWITEPVAGRLVDVAAAPGLDDGADARRIREPNAEDHAGSYEYVRVLRNLSDQ